MTYGLFLLAFLLLPIACLLWLTRPMLDATVIRQIGLYSLVALAYTAPWDNAIVAMGVWTYDPSKIWGIVLGYVPAEEYVFFMLQPLLAGLIFMLARSREKRSE
ncbi:MAG: lycopene cyclase domain-containing protein [Chloroflexota bacterium]